MVALHIVVMLDCENHNNFFVDISKLGSYQGNSILEFGYGTEKHYLVLMSISVSYPTKNKPNNYFRYFNLWK
jgi:hypothetical protein